MNIIQKSLTALAAVALSAGPVNARIEHNTGELLEHISDRGVEVIIGTNECTGHFLGRYQFTSNLSQARMTLCPGDVVDAEDHETVRHEVMHVIQSCINYHRGTALNTPVLDIPDLIEAVNANVPYYDVDTIHSSYPRDQWYVEYEAYLAEYIFTADDLIELFDDACME